MAELLILGIIIGSNNFATALALGSLGSEVSRGRVVPIFGLFEFTFPLVGLWLGQQASSMIADAAGWLGPALLAALGAWIIGAALRGQEPAEDLARRATTWRGLLLLSAGLSLDNLVVGFSLGLGKANPVLVATVIALFSMSFAWAGLQLGDRARGASRLIAEVGTGLLLIALAIAMAMGIV